MPQPATWYFDVISPYAYLALPRLEEISAKRKLILKPVAFGALLKHWGQLGPAELAPKRMHTYRQCVFLAERAGLPFRMPPRHPFMPLAVLRLIVALGCSPGPVRAAFHAIWGEGRDPNAPEVLAAIAQAAGDPSAVERINDPAIKDRLAWNAVQATEAGIFGVPTLLIDGEVFWGGDAMDMALAFLDDPAMFSKGEMARLGAVEVGVVRTTPGKTR